MKALGLLEDPKAIQIVAGFTRGDDSRKGAVKKAAQAALKKLREGKKASVESKELTDDVMKLKEKNEKLEEQLEDLKKQFKAKSDVDTKSDDPEDQESED